MSDRTDDTSVPRMLQLHPEPPYVVAAQEEQGEAPAPQEPVTAEPPWVTNVLAEPDPQAEYDSIRASIAPEAPEPEPEDQADTDQADDWDDDDEDDGVPRVSSHELDGYSKAALVAYAQSHGLDTSGTKDDIRFRIEAAGKVAGD